MQGRVSPADHASGRAAQGFLCNAKVVSHVAGTGGFKTLRYRDASGHTCAFYDSTRMFPTDAAMQLRNGFGVVVLDMSRPAQPVQTTTLTTPAMLSPHESLLVHPGRGLLAAVVGNAFANLGIVDLYDVRTDCRHPRLLSSTPSALLGHESGFAPDGMTFYATSTGGQTLHRDRRHRPGPPGPALRAVRRQLPRAAALARRPDHVCRQHRQRPLGRHPAGRGPPDPRRRPGPGPGAPPAGAPCSPT